LLKSSSARHKFHVHVQNKRHICYLPARCCSCSGCHFVYQLRYSCMPLLFVLSVCSHVHVRHMQLRTLLLLSVLTTSRSMTERKCYGSIGYIYCQATRSSSGARFSSS
jgi:hypothetical protein